MTRRRRDCALLLFSLAGLSMLYYTSEHVIPGYFLPWKTLENRVYLSTPRSEALTATSVEEQITEDRETSSPIEVDEAEHAYDHNEGLGIVIGPSGGLTHSPEKAKATETSRFQKFMAQYIPEESVAEKKFLADQAAVQSVPTEAPGWVYNKTAADLFRKRVVGDSRFANGNFLVTQEMVEKYGLTTDSAKPVQIEVPTEVLKEFPTESPFKNKHFSTCSVVGNGGILKGSGCGKKIDASEFVFRFNMAPMGDTYMEDIGNKTNLITMNPSMIKYRYETDTRREIDVKALLHDLSAYGDSYLWIWAFLSQRHARSAVNVQRALLGTGVPNQVIFPYPLVTGSITTFWTKNGVEARRSSTGLLLVSLATQMCEEVRLYGFWPFHADRNNRRLTEHYYDNALPKEAHSIPDEFRQLQLLHNTGVLRLTTHPCQ
ncbi:alpha-N-acetylneuraminide alpha-2,8-sialyltransferase-like [Branchiostoma floridae x Branchiostoma belcheri]